MCGTLLMLRHSTRLLRINQANTGFIRSKCPLLRMMRTSTIEVRTSTTEVETGGFIPSRTHQLPIRNASGALRCSFFIACPSWNVWNMGWIVWNIRSYPVPATTSDFLCGALCGAFRMDGTRPNNAICTQQDQQIARAVNRIWSMELSWWCNRYRCC